MPVARGPQINARSAVLVGVSGVVVALVIGALVVWASSSSGDVEVRLGDTDFNAGRIGPISETIAEDGPTLYQDLGTSGNRDIYVQHLGGDPETGWLAFAARRAEDPRDCFFSWEPETRDFALVSATDVDCDDVRVDEAGTGLLQYPVEIIDEEIRVELNSRPDENENEDES